MNTTTSATTIPVIAPPERLVTRSLVQLVQVHPVVVMDVEDWQFCLPLVQLPEVWI
jgi:hypothetical protein